MNTPESRLEEAGGLMLDFAERTGLYSDHQPRRYLWTDAFAVCNFLGLAEATGEQRYLDLAMNLIGQVHNVLGRHRDDDPRKGWISGLGPEEGEKHPTLGGLRIGKELPERGPEDPYNERLEWDRDGQYFHYLTKWMHALDQASRKTLDPGFNVWAQELASTAYRTFTYLPSPGSTRRMYWKMSIDLSRPLVPSMGQHDPLEGLVMLMQLGYTAGVLEKVKKRPDLDSVTKQFAGMTAAIDLASTDPLAIGSLLIDAWRMTQLTGMVNRPDPEITGRLLEAAITGLEYYSQGLELQAEAEYRLGFRELGLAIGLHAIEQMQQAAAVNHISINSDTQEMLEVLNKFLSLRKEIESFWREPVHQLADTWTEHRDINEVMLATSLLPDGFLIITKPAGK